MSAEDIIASRAPVYGSFSNVAAKAQAIKMAFFTGGGGCARLQPDHRESLDLIATKIARICCGDPDHKDSWDDIAGYATLVSKRIEKGE